MLLMQLYFKQTEKDLRHILFDNVYISFCIHYVYMLFGSVYNILYSVYGTFEKYADTSINMSANVCVFRFVCEARLEWIKWTVQYFIKGHLQYEILLYSRSSSASFQLREVDRSSENTL